MDSHKLSKVGLFFVQKISAADIEHPPDKLRKQIFQQTISDLERLGIDDFTFPMSGLVLLSSGISNTFCSTVCGTI